MITNYSSLLSAIGKTSDPEAPIKALAVFDAMIASGIKVLINNLNN